MDFIKQEEIVSRHSCLWHHAARVNVYGKIKFIRQHNGMYSIELTVHTLKCLRLHELESHPWFSRKPSLPTFPAINAVEIINFTDLCLVLFFLAVFIF